MSWNKYLYDIINKHLLFGRFKIYFKRFLDAGDSIMHMFPKKMKVSTPPRPKR